MMKVLLLLNVNNTVLALLLVKKEVKSDKCQKSSIDRVNGSKRRSKRVKNLTIDQKGGQNGSKILPKRRSYQKCTKNGSKRRSKRVKDLRELLMLRENRNVKVLLLTVPLVVMLLVLNTSTVFGP